MIEFLGPALGALGSIGGSLIGASAAGADREAARQAYEQSVRDYEAIGIPSAEAEQIVLEKYKSAGQWTPELEQAVKLGDSSMLGISTDPVYTAAAKKALLDLQNLGDQGGMTLQDQANLEKNLGNISAEERGHRQAILQNAAQRGGYGSGAALAAQLANQQDASQRAHQIGLDVNAQAQQRALQAIQAAGQLGTNLQNQEFNEKAKVSEAQDAIARWNAQNLQGVYGRNTGYGNQAQQYNLNAAQNLMNANTDIGNNQETYNKKLIEQNFNNQLALNKAKADARSGQATNFNMNANQTAQNWGNIGSAFAQAGGAVGQRLNQPQQTTTQTVKTPPGVPTEDDWDKEMRG